MTELTDATTYTSANWLVYGDVAQPSTREKMILLAIEEIIKNGPADFNAMHTCDRLGIKHPMVNYYFGNRDGLIAEATWWCYQQWAKQVDRIFHDTYSSAAKRLTAFVEGEISFAKKLGAMHILMHYPLTSKGAEVLVTEKYHDQMRQIFEYHLALIAVTVSDMRSRSYHEIDFTVDSYPRAQLMLKPGLFMAATKIAWMTHGIANWSAGSHVATTRMASEVAQNLTLGIVTRDYIKSIIAMAKSEL